MPEDNDSIKFKRETIEISDGRKLYNYSFQVEDAEASEAFEEQSKESPTLPPGKRSPKRA